MSTPSFSGKPHSKTPPFGLLPLFLILLGPGCALPEPVLRLTPMIPNPVWIGGTAAMTQQSKRARLAVVFARQQDARIAFRVEIENLTESPLLVDPAQFFYTTCVQHGEPRPPTCNRSRFAADPEQVLLALDLDRSRQKADNANNEALLVGGALLGATASVAMASAGHHPAPAPALVGVTAAGTALAAAAPYGPISRLSRVESQQVSAYELERANWSATALRKTTIFPGNSVAGLVFVDRDLSASEVTLHVRVPDEVFAFPFKQTAYQVKREYQHTESIF